MIIAGANDALMDDRLNSSTSGTVAGVVAFRNSQGVEIQGMVLRLERHRVVFEIYGPSALLRTSEILAGFKINVGEKDIYGGKAVVCTMMHTGTLTLCEAGLEDGWMDVDLVSVGAKRLAVGFDEFLRQWQQVYKIDPEYKTIIADLQTFLTDLRLWLEQVELGIRSSPVADRIELEREIAHDLRGPVTSALSDMFERFEEVSDMIEEDLQPAHRAFGQRQLHPHLLCAPFIYRTYTKPLGYAGDYEMMNMIIRNGYEGGSLFAKLVNAYLLDQDGPQAVRNRVDFLTTKIIEETCRTTRLGKTANIFCVACGPAWEVVNFLAEHPLADQARFQLLDFNEETLQYTANKIDEVTKKNHRRTQVKFVKNSVQNLLRGSGKSAAGDSGFDLIYCSGLYDYLNNRVCKALNTHLYDLLLPGGLLVVGNFAPNTPVKNFIEHFLEWFLIYRDGRQLAALAPEQASEGSCVVKAEPTSSNIFLEVRKPQ
jgi:extracellular factor (EF) 3-hydroxypalmitic acid methyl ester biosynthesis protein